MTKAADQSSPVRFLAASGFCSWLTAEEPDVTSAVVAPSASRFDVLCIQRCFPGGYLLLSPPSQLLLTDCFLVSGSMLRNKTKQQQQWRLLCMEITRETETLTSVHTTCLMFQTSFNLSFNNQTSSPSSLSNSADS